MHKRVAITFFGLMVVFGLLIANLGIIGLNLGTSTASQKSNEKSVVLGTSRGMIYDSNGTRLVNTDSQNITICLPTTNAFNTISEFVTDDEKADIYNNMSNGNVSILKCVNYYSKKLIAVFHLVTTGILLHYFLGFFFNVSTC